VKKARKPTVGTYENPAALIVVIAVLCSDVFATITADKFFGFHRTKALPLMPIKP